MRAPLKNLLTEWNCQPLSTHKVRFAIFQYLLEQTKL